MATHSLEHNVVGFRSGMDRSCTGYADAARDHSLGAHQMLALPNENLSVICLAGELWLTRDGDSEDYILGPGQRFVVRRGDQAAVQALRPSRVRLLAA